MIEGASAVHLHLGGTEGARAPLAQQKIMTGYLEKIISAIVPSFLPAERDKTGFWNITDEKYFGDNFFFSNPTHEHILLVRRNWRHHFQKRDIIFKSETPEARHQKRSRHHKRDTISETQ